MIDQDELLGDLRALVARLQDDLRERCGEGGPLRGHTMAEHQAARDAGRTARAYEDWREDYLVQGAVAWVLACVFVRFMEDNGLVDQPLLSGPAERREVARGRRSAHFQRHPEHGDREYLEAVFEYVRALPAVAALFDERHNPLWTLTISSDAARDVQELWWRIEPQTGDLVHDFTDPEWDTRFLGDLYQDLSDHAKKQYALLQTPEFVESFILERTLEPAIAEFGLEHVRLIDPTCGSGHFLLGAFDRLLRRWQDREPGTPAPALTQKALDAIHGVDLNPYATAIARFRLTVAALRASGFSRLREAPRFVINLATGDALLHGRLPGQLAGTSGTSRGLEHAYTTEDLDALTRILRARYHAVVGNPPYITVKDKALNESYRSRYSSCHGHFALSVPFMQRFFDLADLSSDGGEGAGYVGQITANSFMKREFGRVLVEEHVPGWDLSMVVDSSGAYIPGHGTPTVLVFGRGRVPLGDDVRAVMGIRGEPSHPSDPAQGVVWRAIIDQADRPHSVSEWVSVADIHRERFASHPWSLGGGGAAELRERVEELGSLRLDSILDNIGFGAVTREDEVYEVGPTEAYQLRDATRQLVAGEDVRDWSIEAGMPALWPYDSASLKASADEPVLRRLWRWRRGLSERVAFGRTQLQRALEWFEYSMFFAGRFKVPLTITFGEVATHNHFVLDRGGKVFKQTAPVMKLPADAGEEEHLGLLGVLNSSVACFWLQQVCHNKGGPGGAHSKDEKWHDFYALNSSKVGQLPLPAGRPLDHATVLDRLAVERTGLLGELDALFADGARAGLEGEAERDRELGRRLVSLQEELDWHVYSLYGLIDESLHAEPDDAPPIELGERAFEIVLARKRAAGELETTWFARHRSTPITELPADWPEDYRRLVERRIELITTDRDIGLIERPEYKRRWATEPWEKRQASALRAWMLDRLEAVVREGEPRVTTASRLADAVRPDAAFREVAEVYAGRTDLDFGALVAKLVDEEAVPFLAALRYKDSGMAKRAIWEHVWDMQRQEDAIDARIDDEQEARKAKEREVGAIPVPPRYASGDFRSTTIWRLRGKLDVPKERFILYPGSQRGADTSPVLGWAGWDHLEQALALATLIVELREQEGTDVERLTPLCAGLLELLPWLHQWHAEPDERHRGANAEFVEGFLDAQLADLGLTRDVLRAWRPASSTRSRRRPATSATA